MAEHVDLRKCLGNSDRGLGSARHAGSGPHAAAGPLLRQSRRRSLPRRRIRDNLAILLVAAPETPGRHISAVQVTQVTGAIAQYLGFPMESPDRALPIEGRSKTATRGAQ
jgi:hypothetical protein